MEAFNIQENPKVQTVYESYPNHIHPKIMNLRDLIIQTAKEIEEISGIEETLKWGEPSFLAKKGSTIRIDWKKGAPDQYAMYFQCTSKLVATFRVVYKDTFQFEGNRAIVFPLDFKIPKQELKRCIKAALQYHSVKHLPTLGM